MGIIVLSLGWAAGQQPCDCPQGYKCKEAESGSATPATPFAPSGETFVETSCFDEILTQFMIDNDIPGGAVAVMKDGEIVYEQGYGTRVSEKNYKPVSRERRKWRVERSGNSSGGCVS